jgi:two-component system NtrC family sensor kinase
VLTDRNGGGEKFVMPRSRGWNPVAILRVLLAASVIIPLAVFAGAASMLHRAEADAARDRVTHTTDVAFEHAAKVFETHQLLLGEIDELLRGLGDHEILSHEPELHDRLAAIVRDLPQVRDVAVISRDGHPLLAAREFPATHALNLADRDYFVVLRGGYPGTYVSSVLLSREPVPQRFFAVARTRKAMDGFNGVIAILVDPDYFGNYWLRTGAVDARWPGFRIGLARADGALLARQPIPEPDEPWRIPPPVMAQIQASPEQGFRRLQDGGDFDRLVTYRRLATLPIYVFASVPTSAITAAWLRQMATDLLLAVPATLALFGLALVALRRAQAAEAAAALAVAETRRRHIAEEAVRQSQKLEALGQLTGGVAHDFNNLLSVIIGNAELIRGKPPERVERSIGQIMQAARRGAELTQRLLSFSSRRMLSPKPIDLIADLPRLTELLQTSLRGDIRFRCRFADGLWPVEVDPGELEIALINVAANARDAMPDGGRFEFTARNVTIFAGELPGAPDIGGQFVALALTDSGSGMMPDVAARAFEPFFTTKDVGRGTGLGLSQVYGFVRQSGGAIALDSEPGKGTSVRIHLPRASRLPVPDATPETAPPVTSGQPSRRIMLVEDNPEVAEITAEMLRGLGNRVEAVNRARAALDRLADAATFIDVIISDIVMPDGMNGLQFAREVRRRYPDLPVVLVSGYSESLAEAGEEFTVIAKPLTQAALAEAIRRLFVEQSPPRIVVDNTR